MTRIRGKRATETEAQMRGCWDLSGAVSTEAGRDAAKQIVQDTPRKHMSEEISI